MATLNHGILTNAGRNLFNRVINGDSRITYTKVIFCDDKELLNMSDDEIQDLTQINVNNSLETQPASYDEGLLQGQNGEQASEVVVRAIVSNAGSKDDSGNVIQPPLTNGFYPYVSALYASDGTNEILYGLYLKDQPGYMPAYDGFTPQPLQFTWRLYASTTDNFNLSDTKDVYATIAELSTLRNTLQHQISTNVLPDGTDLDNVSQGNYSGIYTSTYKNDPLPKGMSFNLNVLDDGGGDISQLIISPNGMFYRSWYGNGKTHNVPWEKITSSQRTDEAISQLNKSISDNFTKSQSQLSDNVNNLQHQISTNVLPDGTDLDNVSQGSYSGIYTSTYKNDPLPKGISFNLNVLDDGGGDISQLIISPNGMFYRSWYGNGKTHNVPWEKLITQSEANSLITSAVNQSNSDLVHKITNLKNQLSPSIIPNNTDISKLPSGKYIGVYYYNYINKPKEVGSFILNVQKDYGGDTIQNLYTGVSQKSSGFYYRSWYGDANPTWNAL